MQVREIMERVLVTVETDATVEHLCDLMQANHIHGVPVLDEKGGLAGLVSTDDVLFGRMGDPPGSRRGKSRVRDIMTSPAITVEEDTDVEDACRLMWRFRIHHIPVVRDGKLVGIVSSLDLCRSVSEGRIRR